MAEITDAFIKQYSDSLQLVVQQLDSKFSATVQTQGGYAGEGVQPLKQVGAFDFETKTSRLQPTPTKEPDYLSRYVAPQTKIGAPIIDREDKLSLGFDPQSSLMAALRAGAMRAKDDIIIPAFDGVALTGKDGTATTSFPSGQSIANSIGGANSGLNLDKLIAAQELLGKADVDLDMEEISIAFSWAQHSDVLRQVQLMSNASKLQAVVQNNRVVSLMGWKTVVSNRLAKSGTDRKCFVYCKSGIHAGVWQEVETRVSERADLNYALQMWGSFRMGCTRTEEKKVVRLLCYEG